MPHVDLSSVAVREIFPGIRARIVHSERGSFSWVEIDDGTSFPEHHHPHEQVVSVLEGVLELTVDGQTCTLRPGEMFIIPPNARHTGRALERCRVLDVFVPVREDYR